jgi:hypothetical protein
MGHPAFVAGQASWSFLHDLLKQQENSRSLGFARDDQSEGSALLSSRYRGMGISEISAAATPDERLFPPLANAPGGAPLPFVIPSVAEGPAVRLPLTQLSFEKCSCRAKVHFGEAFVVFANTIACAATIPFPSCTVMAWSG